LKRYFEQLKDQPTHFIYNLNIPVEVDPDQVIDDLKGQSLTAFMFTGPHPDLPSLWIALPYLEEDDDSPANAPQGGVTTIPSILEGLSEQYPVKILGKIRCPNYTYRGQYGCTPTVRAWFERGTDLTGIASRIEALGGRTGGPSIPLTYYQVQLVTDEQELEVVGQQVLGELNYVAEVSRYNPLPPSLSASADTSAAEPSKEWEIESVDTEGEVGWDTSLELSEADYPHISYKQYSGGLRYAYQDASGWHIEIVDNTRYAGGDNSLALGGGGYAHISYYVGADRVLKYAYEDSGGWHVETVDNSEYVGTDSSLALDRGGSAHVSYCDREYDDLKYAVKDASGWRIETVDSEGDVGWSTSLALDGDGYAHISYLDWGNGDLRYAHRDASGWHIKAVDADAREHTSLALDRAGYPHISYYGSRALKYAYQDDVGWHIEMVDDVGKPGWYTSLVLDDDGNPHISYNDRAGFDLKYAYQDVSGWHIETVDSEGKVGAFASLALDGRGKPRISYYDWTNGDLKYAFKDGSVLSVNRLDDSRDAVAGVPLTPTPEQLVPGSQGYVDLGCIYVGGTIVLDGEVWGRYGIGVKLSSDQHGAIIADGKICWYKGEDLPEHLPFPLPILQEVEATPTEMPVEGPTCKDLLTPDRIGEGDFEEFGIAEKLENGQFQREVSQDHVACWYQRMIDGAIVEGDHLYYLFDSQSQALLKKQVWWRSDLEERLPSPLMSREQAEAMVEGEVQHSMLVIIHPDTDTFRELKNSADDSGAIHTTGPPTENPCWVVYAYTSRAGGDGAMRLAVVDAVTSEMLGYTDVEQ
jgi:hypothetical protein